MVRNYGTTIRDKIYTVVNSTVSVGGFDYQLKNTKKIKDIYISDFPFEVKEELRNPQVGSVEIRSGDLILQKNKIVLGGINHRQTKSFHKMTNNDKTYFKLLKKANQFEGASVFQNNYKIGMIQKGGQAIISNGELLEFEEAQCNNQLKGPDGRIPDRLPDVRPADSSNDKKILAYHTAGKAIVGHLMPGGSKVAKISIVPRSMSALGYTLQLPTEERFWNSTEELLGQIATALGGCAAGEIIFGETANLASNDFKSAVVEQMVGTYRMRDILGPLVYDNAVGQFLGNNPRRPVSDATAQVIEKEVWDLVDDAYETDLNILRHNLPLLESISHKILQEEVIEGDDLIEMLSNATIPVSQTDSNQETCSEVTFDDVDGSVDPVLFGKIPQSVLSPGGTGGKELFFLPIEEISAMEDMPIYTLYENDYVEMNDAQVACHVKNLFKQAKENAPCIVFIDGIDAICDTIARARGAGIGGGNDEREQTLNQLLTEMDENEENYRILVLAATDDPKVLDAALLRPGRFDRQVIVNAPDIKGRLSILEVHSRKKKLENELTLESIARRTPGFIGADLANLLNEAAILSARKDHEEFSDAIERVMAGPEEKGEIDNKKELVAYQEAGRALLGAVMPAYDPVEKVSIIPGGALKFITPSEERMESGLYRMDYLVPQMVVALGGIVAEEIVYGENEVFTGESNDLQQAVARQMITKFGTSELGPVALGQSKRGMFLGRDIAAARDFSEDTAATIDVKVEQLVDIAYRIATKVLTDNRAVLDEMATMLIEKETIDIQDIQDLLNRSEVKVQSSTFSGFDLALETVRMQRSFQNDKASPDECNPMQPDDDLSELIVNRLILEK